MRSNRYVHSLRFKITLGAVVLLVPILGAYSHLQYWRQYDVMLQNLETVTTAMGQVITGSLRHAMLTNDNGDIQNIINDVAKQNEITNLAVLDKQGVIRISPRSELIGTQLDQQDPTCQVCHRYSPEQRKASVILDPPGGRILRTMTPIENQSECYGCHDASARLDGVLLTDVSMANIDRFMADDLRDSILWSVVVMLLTVVAVNTLMSKLIVTKLEGFVRIIQLLSRGDLAQRVSITSADELGELAHAFNRMAEGLQAREQENRLLTEQLERKKLLRGQLLDKLHHAQELERKRIAHDIHDQLGQVLSAMSMEIDAAEQALPPEQAVLKKRLCHARTVAESAVDQTHALIGDLRPIVLDDLGLVAAVRAYVDQLLSPPEVQVRVSVNGRARRLPPDSEITLFRIVQEAINNIAQHAAAQHVIIGFEFCDNQVAVKVQDNGCGFTVPSEFQPVAEWRGLGLFGIQERAVLAGGIVHIESQPGRGTVLVVTMPLREQRQSTVV